MEIKTANIPFQWQNYSNKANASSSWRRQAEDKTFQNFSKSSSRTSIGWVEKLCKIKQLWEVPRKDTQKHASKSARRINRHQPTLLQMAPLLCLSPWGGSQCFKWISFYLRKFYNMSGYILQSIKEISKFRYTLCSENIPFDWNISNSNIATYISIYFGFGYLES